jgi:hypothetical protein
MSGSPSALTNYVTGTGSVIGPQLNAFVQSCDNFAQLRAFVGAPGILTYSRGQTTPGDGLQGNFWWDATGSTPDDNVNYIVPSGAASGEWIRLPNFIGGTAITSITNIASLEAVTTTTLPQTIVYVEGYYAPTDGGEGVFVVGAAATANSGTIINDASGRSWHRETEGLPYSVKWFGATGLGVVDDTAAIQAAENALEVLGGGRLSFPNGSYKISGTLTINQSQIYWVGYGRFTTLIETVSPTADCIQIGNGTNNPAYITIEGIGFLPSVTRTNGCSVKVRNGHSIRLTDFQIFNEFNGVILDGGPQQYSYHVDNFAIDVSASIGILVGATTEVQDCWIVDGSVSTSQEAVYLAYVSGCYLANLSIILAVNGGVYVAPGPGMQVTAVYCSNVAADTTTNGPGWVFGGSGTISNIVAVNCWGSSNHTHGFYFVNSNTNGVTLSSPIAMNNQMDGVAIGTGVNISVDNGQIFCNSMAGSAVASGIAVGDVVVAFTLTGNVCGLGGSISFISGNNQNYGIVVGTGCSNYIIKDNICLSNVTGSILDQSNAGIVNDNIGFPTQGSGQGTIASGTSSVAVTHNLAATPLLQNIIVTPAGSWSAASVTSFWVSAANSSTFTVNVGANTTGNWVFNWTAYVRNF